MSESIKHDVRKGIDLRGAGDTRNVRGTITIDTSANYSAGLSEGYYWVFSTENCAIGVGSDADFAATALTYANGWPIFGTASFDKEGAQFVREGQKIGVIGDATSPGTASLNYHKVD